MGPNVFYPDFFDAAAGKKRVLSEIGINGVFQSETRDAPVKTASPPASKRMVQQIHGLGDPGASGAAQPRQVGAVVDGSFPNQAVKVDRTAENRSCALPLILFSLAPNLILHPTGVVRSWPTMVCLYLSTLFWTRSP